MAVVSLFGGLALANAGFGAIHGFAAVIGGAFSVPHGTVCGYLLPQAMAINVRALRERLPGGEALRRYEEVAQMLTGRSTATPEDGLAWMQELCDTLKVSSFACCGMSPKDFPFVVEKASVSSSMQANPIKLTAEEMEEILSLAL